MYVTDPSTPTDFTFAQVSTASGVLSWTAGPGRRDKYIINHSPGNGMYDNIPATTTHKTISGLAVDTKYTFMIKAVSNELFSYAAKTYATIKAPTQCKLSIKICFNLMDKKVNCPTCILAVNLYFNKQ